MKSLAFLFAALLICAAVFAEDEKTETPEVESFVAPKPQGSYVFFENFDDDDWRSRWHVIQTGPYAGQWKVGSGSLNEGIVGDQGLIMTTPGARHAVSAALSKPEGNENKDLVIQYELRAENKFGCDGGYIKLVSDLDFTPEGFKDDTPYSIMFGPDRCGNTDKVHFILRHKNPKTGEFEEKHLKDAPRVPGDKLTHVYTLVIRADNTYEVLIDEQSKSKGSLFEAFTPSINPPKEIDDPSDKKPSDWVDDEYIDDPEDKKPEDWDENAPPMIEDASATKPEGWLDDAPATVADPNAKQPADWDEEEDGEWEAPQVPNPVCESIGCGEWKPPMIKNPKFKGKWSAKKIKNPKFIGVWKPRKIDNPDFFEDKQPSNVFPIAGVGIELLTNGGYIVFDNILITHDEKVAEQVRADTWRKRHEKESKAYNTDDYKDEKEKKNKDFFSTAFEIFSDNPIPICIGILTLSLLIFLIVWRCCLSEEVVIEEAKTVGEKKKTDAVSADDKDDAAPAAEAAAAAAGGEATESSPSKKKVTARKSKKADN